MLKKGPNPNGKKGGKEHQKKISEIEEEISRKDLLTGRETKIPLENNKKRYADVTGTDFNTGDLKEIHQIGKQNKNGTPVKRERKAIEDIEKATGLKVIFHPYNVFIFVVLLLITVAFYIY